MSLITIIITLIVVGVLLWLINTYLAKFMDAKIVQVLNIVVVILVVLWLLKIFGVWAYLSNVKA